MLAFRDELQKTSAIASKLLGAGGGAGVGALLGAAGGGLVGAVRGAHQAGDAGESRLSGGLAGALGGASAGAGLGALGGAATGALRSDAIQKLTRTEGMAGSAARFGERQVHALTGVVPKGGIEAIRGGAYDARQALKGANSPQARKGLAAAEASQKMGLTSLPGYVNAVRREGLKNVAKTDLAAQWHSGGIGTKALGVGLPAAMLASDIAKKEQPTGTGKGESVGRSLGGAVGGLLGSSMPISGQLALGAATGVAGRYVGRGVDRLRGRPASKPPLTPPEQQQGSHVPTERVMSPAAMGKPPEGMHA